MLPMAGAGVFGRTTMKWITREHPRVDRVACPWLIEKFVDKQAEFLYVPSDQVAAEAQKRGATPYDIKEVELGHHGPECSLDRKSTRLNSSHSQISYAVFCLKKKKKDNTN